MQSQLPCSAHTTFVVSCWRQISSLRQANQWQWLEASAVHHLMNKKFLPSKFFILVRNFLSPRFAGNATWRAHYALMWRWVKWEENGFSNGSITGWQVPSSWKLISSRKEVKEIKSIKCVEFTAMISSSIHSHPESILKFITFHIDMTPVGCANCVDRDSSRSCQTQATR